MWYIITQYAVEFTVVDLCLYIALCFKGPTISKLIACSDKNFLCRGFSLNVYVYKSGGFNIIKINLRMEIYNHNIIKGNIKTPVSYIIEIYTQ